MSHPARKTFRPVCDLSDEELQAIVANSSKNWLYMSAREKAAVAELKARGLWRLGSLRQR